MKKGKLLGLLGLGAGLVAAGWGVSKCLKKDQPEEIEATEEYEQDFNETDYEEYQED